MNYLEIPTNNGNPKDPNTTLCLIDNVEEMNEHLTKYNKIHFSQAQNTPFTIPPLSTNLGHSGLTPIGDSITDGQYLPPQGMDPFTKLLLCHTRQRCPTISNPVISTGSLRQVLKKWRESTSTSPSGRHLGHMKTLTYIANETNWPIQTYLPQSIFQMIADILNLCIKHCIPLQRWQTVRNMMIQKEPGNQKIHRLHVIHIQENNWQAFFKIVSRQNNNTPRLSSSRPAPKPIWRCTRLSSHHTCHPQRNYSRLLTNDSFPSCHHL